MKVDLINGFLGLLTLAALARCWYTEVRLGKAAMDRQALERSALLMEQTRGILEKIAEDAPLTDVLHALTSTIERLSPGCWCSVLLLSEDKRSLTTGSGGSLPTAYYEAINGIEIGPEVGSCGTAAFLNQTVITTDIATDPRWTSFRELAARHGLRSCWSVPIRGSNNQVLGAFAIYRARPAQPEEGELDVAESGARLAAIAIERLTTHQQLNENARRLRLAEEAAGCGVWAFDRATEMYTFSAGGARLGGFAPVAQQRSRTEVDALVHPADLDSVHAARRLVSAQKSYSVEFRVRSPNGTSHWRRSAGRLESDRPGARIIGLLIDITEEREILEKLRESAERLRLAEQAAGFGIWEFDPGREAFTLSEGAAVMAGLGPHALCVPEADLIATIHPDDRASAIAACEQTAKNGGVYEHEFRRLFPNGSVRWYRNRARVEFAGDLPARVVGAIIDITEQKQLIEQLRGFPHAGPGGITQLAQQLSAATDKPAKV